MFVSKRASYCGFVDDFTIPEARELAAWQTAREMIIGMSIYLVFEKSLRILLKLFRGKRFQESKRHCHRNRRAPVVLETLVATFPQFQFRIIDRIHIQPLIE